MPVAVPAKGEVVHVLEVINVAKVVVLLGPLRVYLIQISRFNLGFFILPSKVANLCFLWMNLAETFL